MGRDLQSGRSAVTLAGWAVSDNGGRDALPAFTWPPGEYLVIAATAAGFRTNYPGFTGKLVSLEGTIGNGLSNTGDVVRLLAPDGAIVDAMSYGENTAAFDPPCPDVPAGRSLARVLPGMTPIRRPTGRPRRSPTPAALASVPAHADANPHGPDRCDRYPDADRHDHAPPRLQPPPARCRSCASTRSCRGRTRWIGTGTAQVDAYDEWIEIVNLGPGVADLGGWALDDILGGGSAAYAFPPGTLLGPGGFLVRYRSTTGVALNQDADTVNLLAPDGSVVDSFSYTAPGRDASYSRAVDGTGDWTDAYPPSPGGPNLPGTRRRQARPPPPARRRPPRPRRNAHADADRRPAAARPAERDPALAGRGRLGRDGAADAYDEWIE